MTASDSCPAWCQLPAGHLRPEPGGPGDHHIAEVAEIDIPEIPGLRSAESGPLCVRVEQYVTASTVHPAVISADFGDRAPTRGGFEYLTAQEAQALAWMLIRAATTSAAGTCLQRFDRKDIAGERA